MSFNYSAFVSWLYYRPDWDTRIWEDPTLYFLRQTEEGWDVSVIEVWPTVQETPPFVPDVGAFVYAQNNGDTFLVTVSDYSTGGDTPSTLIWRSTDGAETWTELDSIPYAIHWLDWADGSYIAIGWTDAEGPGVLTSDDNGQTWTASYTLPSTIVNNYDEQIITATSFAFDETTGTWHIGMADDWDSEFVYYTQSQDLGVTWSDVQSFEYGYDLGYAGIAANDGYVVMGGCPWGDDAEEEFELYISSDNGQTFAAPLTQTLTLDDGEHVWEDCYGWLCMPALIMDDQTVSLMIPVAFDGAPEGHIFEPAIGPWYMQVVTAEYRDVAPVLDGPTLIEGEGVESSTYNSFVAGGHAQNQSGAYALAMHNVVPVGLDENNDQGSRDPVDGYYTNHFWWTPLCFYHWEGSSFVVSDIWGTDNAGPFGDFPPLDIDFIGCGRANADWSRNWWGTGWRLSPWRTGEGQIYVSGNMSAWRGEEGSIYVLGSAYDTAPSGGQIYVSGSTYN